MCGCVRERECVCGVCEGVCVGCAKECVCVCVRESVWVCERECVCAFCSKGSQTVHTHEQEDSSALQHCVM